MATPIENDNAVEYEGRYNVCQRSGRKAYPGELIKDPYTNAWVLPEYVDPYPSTLRVKVASESLEGPVRPEHDDLFIDSVTDPATL